MKLQDLLYKVNILKVVGATNIEISEVQFDSRKIKKKGLFVAIKGSISDGHQYIRNTIKDGAIAIIVDIMAISSLIVVRKTWTWQAKPRARV